MADEEWTPLAHKVAEKLHDTERTVRALQYNLVEVQGWLTEARAEIGALKAERRGVGGAMSANPVVDLGATARDTDDELDIVYHDIDAFLRHGCFRMVDDLLRALDVDAKEVAILLAYLSITYAAKALLTERAPLLARVRRRLERTDPARVDALLGGLE